MKVNEPPLSALKNPRWLSFAEVQKSTREFSHGFELRKIRMIIVLKKSLKVEFWHEHV
jgi:hypothetical protein